MYRLVKNLLNNSVFISECTHLLKTHLKLLNVVILKQLS